MHPPASLVYVIKDFFFPNNSFMHDHRLNDCTMQIYFMLPVRAKVQWGCFGSPPPPSHFSLTHSPWSQVGSQRCSGLTAMESFRNLRPVLWQKEGGRCFKRIGAVLNVQTAGRGDAAPPIPYTPKYNWGGAWTCQSWDEFSNIPVPGSSGFYNFSIWLLFCIL